MDKKVFKRKKGTYYFLLAISIFSIIISVFVYSKIPLLKFLAIPSIAVFSFSSIIWLYFIFDKRGIIEIGNSCIVLREALKKTKVSFNDLIEASFTPAKGKENDGVISVTVKVAEKERKITLYEIGNAKEAFLIINEIIENNK